MPRRTMVILLAPIAIALAAGACASSRAGTEAVSDAAPASVARRPSADATALPAGAATVSQRLTASPRHAEWAMIRTSAGDSVRAWVVYPERSSRAPVIVVVHENVGLTAWVRGVADQLAAAGYIAVAPDLLTGKATLEGDTIPAAVARSAIGMLRTEDVQRQLEAAGQYGMSLAAALPRYAIVGFCWGGAASFAHAVRSPSGLAASVVYYGSSPDTSQLARVRVPVLGLYAGDDERINARIPATDSVMKALGKSFRPHFFDGAGHGFLRGQDGRPANREASERAWPLTLAFFRQHLGT